MLPIQRLNMFYPSQCLLVFAALSVEAPHFCDCNMQGSGSFPTIFIGKFVGAEVWRGIAAEVETSDAIVVREPVSGEKAVRKQSSCGFFFFFLI